MANLSVKFDELEDDKIFDQATMIIRLMPPFMDGYFKNPEYPGEDFVHYQG